MDVQKYRRMGKDKDQSSHAALAREAEPVRRWLTGYFRRRVRDHGDVEDLVQDVFARIVARDNGQPVENLAAYVFRTAASVLADRARRRASRHADLHVAFDSDQHGDEEIDPERVLGGKEDLNAATAALLALPERTRTVFILRRLEGYRHAEIARHLGISVSAVEKHMVKAVRHLGAEMEKRDAS
jgi:RNA polymerase sigma factor (sigma-70 family)